MERSLTEASINAYRPQRQTLLKKFQYHHNECSHYYSYRQNHLYLKKQSGSSFNVTEGKYVGEYSAINRKPRNWLFSTFSHDIIIVTQ